VLSAGYLYDFIVLDVQLLPSALINLAKLKPSCIKCFRNLLYS
jgi:hypothetical protein